MNEDLKYRKAEPADAERIMEIIRQAQAQMRTHQQGRKHGGDHQQRHLLLQ